MLLLWSVFQYKFWWSIRRVIQTEALNPFSLNIGDSLLMSEIIIHLPKFFWSEWMHVLYGKKKLAGFLSSLRTPSIYLLILCWEILLFHRFTLLFLQLKHKINYCQELCATFITITSVKLCWFIQFRRGICTRLIF